MLCKKIRVRIVGNHMSYMGGTISCRIPKDAKQIGSKHKSDNIKLETVTYGLRVRKMLINPPMTQWKECFKTEHKLNSAISIQ